MTGFQPPSAVVLYRRILRSLRGFDDRGQRWYYKNWSRGHIASHSDEDDPERLRFLLAKGEEHRLWILRKYDKPDPLAGGGGGGGGR